MTHNSNTRVWVQVEDDDLENYQVRKVLSTFYIYGHMCTIEWQQNETILYTKIIIGDGLQDGCGLCTGLCFLLGDMRKHARHFPPWVLVHD